MHLLVLIPRSHKINFHRPYLCFRIMDINDPDTRKRALRILIIVAIIIVIVFILSFVFKVVLIPSLIGTILVVCIIAYIGHRIYVKKRQSVSTTNELILIASNLWGERQQNLTFWHDTVFCSCE